MAIAKQAPFVPEPIKKDAQIDALFWEEVKGKSWAFPLPPADSHYWSFSRNFHTFEPDRHWRKVSAPVLLVYGERDQRVPARRSAAHITRAILEEAGHSVTVHIFPDADHTFRLRSPDRVWPMTAEGYPELLIEWTTSVAGRVGTATRSSPPPPRSTPR